MNQWQRLYCITKWLPVWWIWIFLIKCQFLTVSRVNTLKHTHLFHAHNKSWNAIFPETQNFKHDLSLPFHDMKCVVVMFLMTTFSPWHLSQIHDIIPLVVILTRFENMLFWVTVSTNIHGECVWGHSIKHNVMPMLSKDSFEEDSLLQNFMSLTVFVVNRDLCVC